MCRKFIFDVFYILLSTAFHIIVCVAGRIVHTRKVLEEELQDEELEDVWRMRMTCFEILGTCAAAKIAASLPKLPRAKKQFRPAMQAIDIKYITYGIIQYTLFGFICQFWLSGQFLMYNLLESFQV